MTIAYVVTDPLSRSIATPTPISSPGNDDTEPELIQMLWTQFELNLIRTTLRTYIGPGCLALVPEELDSRSNLHAGETW